MKLKKNFSTINHILGKVTNFMLLFIFYLIVLMFKSVLIRWNLGVSQKLQEIQKMLRYFPTIFSKLTKL